jgi:hypothetical protein
MADNDTILDQAGADGGASSHEPSPSPSSSADHQPGAPAGADQSVDRGDASSPESSDDTSLYDEVLGKFPPAADHDDDPIARPLSSQAGDKSPETDPNAAKTQVDAAQEPEKPAVPERPDARPEDWLSKAEMDALGPKAKLRIENLWKENRDYKSFAVQADPFLKPLRDNMLPQADVVQMANMVGALNRGDFQTFYQQAKPYMDYVEERLGIKLPQEIRAKVDEGELTEDVANELAKAKFVAEDAQRQRDVANQALERTQQQGQQQQVAQHGQAVANAINGWEEQQKARDPDFPKLRPLIANQMIAFVSQHGPPPTVQDALNLAEYARQEVAKVTAGFTPPPRGGTTNKVPVGNGAARNIPRAEPKNVYDHVFARLGLG